MSCRVRARRSCAQSRVSARFCASTSLFRSTVRRWSWAVDARSSWNNVAGCFCLPPPAPWLKDRLARLGPPLDGVGLVLALLDHGEERPSQSLHGQGVSADDLHQLAKLGGLLRPDLPCLVHEGLELGIVVPRLARLLASTRADVAVLNGLARERLRASGEPGADQVVATERGERSLAAGDRVMFGRNERGLGAGPGGRGGVAVKNGTLGTVLGVEAGGGRLTVRVDGAGGSGSSQGGQAGRDVTFSLGEYGHVDHGYAATVHKAQGVTADRAHVLASRYMDRHAAYVGLTRHRAGVVLHYAREEFADTAALAGGGSLAGLRGSVASLPEADTALSTLYQDVTGHPISTETLQALQGQLEQPGESLDTVRARVAFSDGKAAVDGLYLWKLGRTADPGGEAGWQADLAAGTTVSEAAVEFAQSAEAASTIGNLYSSLTGKVATTAQVAQYLGLDAGGVVAV